MHVVRLADAPPYQAPGHHDVGCLRLMGLEAGGSQGHWVGLSYYLPGSTVDMGAGPTEKTYIVLEGELTVILADGAEHVLGPLDSCCIAAGEERAAENRTHRVTTILVVMPTPPAS